MSLFDPVQYLDCSEVIKDFLLDAADCGDENYYRLCLEQAMRAEAINLLAIKTGIDRQEIYEMFLEKTKKPNQVFVHKVTAAFGVTAPIHA